MKKSNLLAMAAVLAVMVLAFYAAAAPPQQPTNPLPINIPGYEVALGSPCTTSTATTPQQCGVVFFGWTGGTGPFPLNPNPTESGWISSPGTGEGSWSANLDYEGTPGYGNRVTLLGGYFNLEFTNRTAISGVVTGGTIEWPADDESIVASPLCGPGIATIAVQLSTGGPGVGSSTPPLPPPNPHAASFTGCLLDQYPNIYGISLSASSPPLIWGTLIAR